jgi:hypothetical protein
VLKAQDRSKSWQLVALASVGVAIRLAPLMRADRTFVFRADDSYEYLQLAAGMRHGCGFARLIGGLCQSSEILRTPGYPVFLAIMPSISLALFGQALMSGMLCFAVGWWLQRYWNRAAALVGEGLVAFDVPSLVMSSELMSEALFQCIVFFAVASALFLLFLPRRQLVTAICTGLATALAIMIRPIGILLPLLTPLPFLLMPSVDHRRRWVAGVVAFGIPAAVIVAWSIRNYRVADYPGLSTVSAINLYYYRAADVIARDQGTLLEATRKSFGSKLGVPYEHIYEANFQSPELTERMNHLAIGILRAHAVQALAMTFQSAIYVALVPMRSPLARLLGTLGGSAGEGLSSGAPSLSRLRQTLLTTFSSPLLSVAVLVETLLTIALWIGLFAAVVRCRQQRAMYRVTTLYLAAVGLILILLAAGGEADARFRVPAIPLLSIVAALGYFPKRTAPAELGAMDTVRTSPPKRIVSPD